MKNSTFDESSHLQSLHRTPEARSPPHNPFQSPQGLAGGSLSKAGSGESNMQECTKLQVYVYAKRLCLNTKCHKSLRAQVRATSVAGLTVKVKGCAF